MTLVVLALDALDAGLVELFDLDALRLDEHGEMETVAEMMELPYTPEAWATIATGLEPSEHGVTGSGISRWNNVFVDFLSNFTGTLPLPIRIRLGEVANDVTGADYAVDETDSPSIFDGEGRFVHNWPGIANGEELAEVWKVMSTKEEKTIGEFEREIYGIGAGKFAWAEEMLNHEAALVGVHIHVLDALGHVHASDRARLRRAYEWAAEWVRRIRERLDEDDDLVLLSDHGMVVSFYDDERDRDVGDHSWRAYVAATFGGVPEDVYGVRDWLEAHVGDYEDDSEDLELPEEQLRQLGYIE